MVVRLLLNCISFALEGGAGISLLYMKELLEVIAKGLVNNKDAVEVVVDDINSEGVIAYHLHVDPDDMGRVIGKQGRIAKAVRILMRAGATRVNQKISVEID